MGRVFQPKYWKRLPGGRRKQVKTKAWYAEWQVAGSTRRKKIGTKRAATSALAKFEDKEVRRRHGLPDPAAEAEARNRPLAKLLTEYVANLAAKDTSPEHRGNVDAQLTRVLSECGWHVFGDIDADAFVRFLGRLRDHPRARAIRGAAKQPGGPQVSKKVPAKGLAPTTLNGYIRTAKAFTRWLAEKVGALPPLAKVEDYPEEVDLRRSRRILTDDELAKLLVAAVTATGRRRSRGCVRGHDRAMLYRLAAYTGLRAGELAELTPAHFALCADPPTVTVPARESKGKREEPIPLPAHLVELLVPWLAGRPRDEKVFPGNWAKYKHQSQWLNWDLGRAGVDARDEQGRPATFHSLKRRYVTRVIDADAKLHQVRRLARHADIRTTIKHYTNEDMKDLGAIADKLADVSRTELRQESAKKSERGCPREPKR